MSQETLQTDATILQNLGQRLSRHRIEAGMTQAELAEQSGVSKRTVERVEAGESTQSVTLVRIFRVLGLLENLEQALPLPGPGPLELLKSKGKIRQRASSKQPQLPDEPWRWGDGN